ncbi:MAG: thiamine phosphate synthase [bacterium]
MPANSKIDNQALMFITDRTRALGRPNIEVVRAALEGGCRLIQYRELDLPDRDFYNECLKIKELCDEVDATFIVNDRLDIALLIKADGVHLGHIDLPLKVVKEYAGEEFIIGYSAHSVEEAITASWEGADYLSYSPMFPLEHKQSPFKPFGIDGAKTLLEKIKIPVFFLGGIRISHLDQIAQSLSPSRIACVSLISEAANVSSRVEEILSVLRPGE